ncbi:ATP synthase F1 subunit epsilon [Acidithiobacillus sp. M4-SHS-6]|uniref:ATP synthase F1 subunit epsilon n=1 Tax=Acidithiobacillus sp. M4-SHS-6 TaxID=3383024 RepID=UPI0039BE3460
MSMSKAQHHFRLQIVDVHGEIYNDLATFVVVPGELGELGILFGHAPLISILRAGELRITPVKGPPEILFIEGGLVEVQSAIVTVLAHNGMRVSDIDPKISQSRISDAERVLKAHHGTDMDFAVAELELQKELAKLRAFQRYQQAQQLGNKQVYDWERPPLEGIPEINVQALED